MKIAFCGDLVLRNPQQHKLGSTLQSILSDVAIKVLNFEVPVEIKGGKGIHKSGPVHCQSASSPEWVQKYGFNLVTLANNHSMDYGEKGLKATLKAFDKINVTGVGTFDSAYEVTVITRDNLKIGFLGVTHKEFGCVDEYSGDRLGTAMATSSRVYKSIVEVRQTVDKLYILPHAGVEYMDLPLPEWWEIYKTYVDLGADGVFASHPHVPQGWEIYKDKPIFYSLGNFLFEVPDIETRHSKWCSSLLVIIDTDTTAIKVYPLRYDYISKTVDVDNTEEIESHISYLNNLLKPKSYEMSILSSIRNLEERYNKMMIYGGAYSIGTKEKIKNIIRPILGKKRFVGDAVHLLNLFQCESHRWVMMRLLEKNNSSTR